MRAAFIIITCLSIFVVAHALTSTSSSSFDSCTFFVRNDGEDTHLGTTPDAPFRTLARAQSAVREKLRQYVPKPNVYFNPFNPEEVCIFPGVYKESLHFSSLDSGHETSPVVWRGLEAGRVRISGGADVLFAPISPTDPVYAYLNASTIAHLVVAQLSLTQNPLSNFSKRGGFEWSCVAGPSMLVFNGLTQDIARWPNVGEQFNGHAYGDTFAYTVPVNGDKYTHTSSYFQADTDTPLATQYLANQDPPLLYDTANIWAHGYWWWDWSEQWVRVTDFTTLSNGQVNISIFPPAPNNITAGARYYLTNSLNFLDAPGEFYINTTSGSIYFYPPTPTTSSASAPLEGTITINATVWTGTSVSNQVFSNLVFEAVTGDAIDCMNCFNVVFENCTVQHTGAHGVSFEMSNSSAFLGGTVFDTGGRGVTFSSGGDRHTLIPSKNMIANSTITDFQKACFTYNPGTNVDTGGSIVSNEIAYGPHIGITFSGNDILVQYNIVHDCTQSTFDNAGLYFYPGDWTNTWGTRIDTNFFYNNGNNPTRCNVNTQNFRASVYMDNVGAGLTVSNNVIWQTIPQDPPQAKCELCTQQDFFATGINNDGGRSSQFYNNIIIDVASVASSWQSHNSSGTYNSGGELIWYPTIKENSSSVYAAMREYNWNTGIYAERFPSLSVLYDFYAEDCANDWPCPAAPFNNSFTTNVLVNVTQILLAPNQTDSGFNSTANFNTSNNLQTMDPGWALPDPRGALNFTLSPSSPAYSMGFQRIAQECFGPFKC